MLLNSHGRHPLAQLTALLIGIQSVAGAKEPCQPPRLDVTWTARIEPRMINVELLQPCRYACLVTALLTKLERAEANKLTPAMTL